MRKFYRVCNTDTEQGLWYTFNGEFTGLIHKDFNFCQNSTLEMLFDEEIVGWLSAAESLEDLYKWFSREDILELQKHGYCIHLYECEDYKFYEKFQHYVIKQGETNLLEKIILN